VALLAVRDQSAFRVIIASVPLERRARGAGANEASADLQDWASIDADRPSASIEKAESARERTRQANITAFIP
jgi:hypothetical protein